MLGVFAAFAAVGFVAAYVGPTGMALSGANAEEGESVSLYANSIGDVQSFASGEGPDDDARALDRGSY